MNVIKHKKSPTIGCLVAGRRLRIQIHMYIAGQFGGGKINSFLLIACILSGKYKTKSSAMWEWIDWEIQWVLPGSAENTFEI